MIGQSLLSGEILKNAVATLFRFQHDLFLLKSFICGILRFLRARFPADGADLRR
jgi:hypothetical protein